MDERERAERRRRARPTSARRRDAAKAKKSANAAGTSSCRDAVAGSASDTYEPPCPAAKQKSASDAASTATPAADEPKTRRPASQATRQASGTSSDASWFSDDRRVEPGELRDEREEAVPERERVAGVKPAVA